ncbi:MAG: MFS transporter [Sciscionella sp.]
MAAATPREALGLPRVAGRRSVLAAAVIDSLGSGVFLPIAVVYFLRTTPLAITTVGLGLSVASALVVPLLPAAGWAVDRYGASRSVVAANALQMTGFLGYLWVGTFWQLVVSALLMAAGRRLFWTANGPLVALVAHTGERARWFALLRALRNGGFALGGALAALTLGLASQSAFHALVILNAASFLTAGLLMAVWSATSPAAAASRVTATRHPDATCAPAPAASRRRFALRGRSGYRDVFADRAFGLLLGANVLFVFCALVLDVLLTVYLTTILHRPAWLAGLLFTLSGVLVVATQTVTTRRTERHRPTRVLQLAAGLWAASFALLWALAAAPGRLVLPGLILAIACFTAAETLAMPTLNTLALSLAPAEYRGRYFAVQGLAWICPQAVAPAALTWLFEHGTAWPWIAVIIASGLSIAALARLHHRLPDATGPVEPSAPE